MHWSPEDARQHTGLANNRERQALWANAANRVLATTGDADKAIRIANSAVYNAVNRPVMARVRKRQERRERLFRFI